MPAGLQYFPDRATAVSEMARVLSPGGRLALNVWGALDRQPSHAAVIAAVGKFLGAEAEAAFDLAFSLNTADELRHLARDAGLNAMRLRFEHRTLRYPVSAGMVVGFMRATAVTTQFAALSSRPACLLCKRCGLAVPVENHFLTALKPT